MNTGASYSFVVQVLVHFWRVAGTSTVSSGPASKALQHPIHILSPIEGPDYIPCPFPSDIVPCECTVNEDYSMDMDCSKIHSEAELKRIFNQDFPFYKFQKLIIENNENLRVLNTGALGNASFKEININNCSLNEIEVDALEHSQATLECLRLNDNNLWSSPSFDFTLFPKLSYLSVQRNSFTVFPELISYSLRTLFLDGNDFVHIPSESTKGLPMLEIISLQHCSITELSSASFSSNILLSAVNLGFNNLTHLPNGAIQLSGPNSQLGLQNNKISHLSKDSFSGVKLVMDVTDNCLEELDEVVVWRPLLEDGVFLTLEGNPFICGCDIAWLIVNRTLLGRIGDKPTCHGGEAFFDLDPSIYEALCF